MSNAAQSGFNIQATLFFAPEDIQKVLEALIPVYEKTIAEPECHSFQVYQLLDDPGQIRLVEDWSVEVLQSKHLFHLELILIYRETPLDRYMAVRQYVHTYIKLPQKARDV